MYVTTIRRVGVWSCILCVGEFRETSYTHTFSIVSYSLSMVYGVYAGVFTISPSFSIRRESIKIKLGIKKPLEITLEVLDRILKWTEKTTGQ